MWEVEIHKHHEHLTTNGNKAFDYSWVAIDLINGEERERVANWLDHEGAEAFKRAIMEARREARRRNNNEYKGPDDWEIREMHSYGTQSLFPWFIRFVIEKQEQRIEVGTARLEVVGEVRAMRIQAEAELERIKLAEQLAEQGSSSKRGNKCL